ncbi:hypothetical protein Taro_034575 [Colocasia esculenta]|uniref:Uncharacterized protein n=1 Tax=Colocasia esculenta TaxID=4460 RepID=A0A843VY45_COLES|nr:hypothetical protein [Colocasia esculenta]
MPLTQKREVVCLGVRRPYSWVCRHTSSYVDLRSTAPHSNIEGVNEVGRSVVELELRELEL